MKTTRLWTLTHVYDNGSSVYLVLSDKKPSEKVVAEVIPSFDPDSEDEWVAVEEVRPGEAIPVFDDGDKKGFIQAKDAIAAIWYNAGLR